MKYQTHKNICFYFSRNELLTYSHTNTSFYSCNHNKGKGHHYGSKNVKTKKKSCHTGSLFHLTHTVVHFLSDKLITYAVTNTVTTKKDVESD